MFNSERSTPTVTSAAGGASHRDYVESVLRRKTPPRIVYAPNYWQWFAHHQHHGLLPPECFPHAQPGSHRLPSLTPGPPCPVRPPPRTPRSRPRPHDRRGQ